ncbi:hypothetical protein ANCDUO_16822 [Ancylostoma duodenale]|uniref:Uncharacterized protein n=1 Tax=Ancylostoma duodenale TaxID=51022 RepID=A0A0C2G7L7_9BILA|nr:hypothetical protein ANCDUO_16822 [Ancylostoma duodenale]
MNNDGSPASTIAPTLDLQALLATMPDFSMMNNLQNSMPKDRSTGENSIPTSQSLLFPTIPNDQLAALSLGLFPLPGFPMFPLLPMGPMGTSGLPPHSTIESLGLMTNNLRQSTSTTATSMAPPSLDIRPRAFSSAATLQRPKQAATPERRRKRSRKTQEEENEGSVLRMLMDEEDDTPIKIRQQAPTKDLDEKLRMDAAKVLSVSSPPPAKRASPDRLADLIEEQPQTTIALRRIIRDEDLPDSIGPDSPFRHHPKYQRKQRGSDDEVIEGMEALTAFCMVNGYVPDSSDSSPSPKNDSGYASAGSPKKSFAEMMEHAICRELVTAE